REEVAQLPRRPRLVGQLEVAHHVPNFHGGEPTRRCGEPACRRDSVRPRGRGGHPSVRPTWGVGRAVLPTLGLAPGGVCRAVRVAPGAGALLPHRFTLACARRPSAVCSLWHFPAGRPDWPLTSTLPCGVPTFLDTVHAVPRPPGRLATRSRVRLAVLGRWPSVGTLAERPRTRGGVRTRGWRAPAPSGWRGR